MMMITTMRISLLATGLAIVAMMDGAIAMTTTAISNAVELPQGGLRADSRLGMRLLSQARRLEDGGGEDAAAEEEENNDAVDMTWVKNFSIKFQGCHYIQQVSRPT